MGRTIRRVGVFLLAVAALCVFLVVDGRLKAGEGLGFCPADARWTVVQPDLPAFWRQLQRSDSYRAVREEWDPLGAPALAVRKATGIRPLPVRWSLWMGKSLLCAGGDAGTGGCVRPGLLMRAAHAVNAVFNRSQDGVHRYGQFHYAWRDGFLIFSTSPDYVRASLEAAPFQSDPVETAFELQWRRRAVPEAFVRFHVDDGLPVEGWVDAAVTERDAPLEIPTEPEDEPLLEIAATAPADVAAVWDLLERSFEAAAAVAPPWPLALPPAVADEPPSGTSLCVLSIHESRNFESPSPTYRLSRLRPAVEAGLSQAPDRVLTEGPEGAVAESEAEPRVVEADAAVRLVWAPFARTAEARLMETAEGISDDEQRDDLLRSRVPVARGLARAGTLDLQGTSDDGRLAFSGHLAQSPALDTDG